MILPFTYRFHLKFYVTMELLVAKVGDSMTVAIQQQIQHIFYTEGRLLALQKGTCIPLDDELANHIAYIHKGHVQLTQQTLGGKELTVRICSEAGLIGDITLFAQTSTSPFSATALTTVELYVLPKTVMELRMQQQPDAMIEYMQWLQLENLKHQSLLRDLLLHGKKGALFSTLIRLANTYGQPQPCGSIFIDLALTNTELANLCGTSREMINRMLNDLKKHHIISFDKGYITVHELEQLKHAIDCENCPIAVCRID